MRWIIWAGLTFFCWASLAACLQVSAPSSPAPTGTAVPPSQTPTATTVWFPPTATFTPLPTVTLSITPTLDTRPLYGNLIFQDDFTQPENWTLGKMSAGNVALGENELSLGVSQPPGYLFSLRRATSLDDFYMEITASPSICRGKDEYGLLLRVSPASDFYRFGLNCAGEARLDRYLAGQAASLHPPTPNGVVPPGAPSSSRLAVWAIQRDLRFYVNGVFVFSIRDASLPKGGLGLYARAAGPEAVTVNFSDLTVYQAAP
jgi:hypothetical protein